MAEPTMKRTSTTRVLALLCGIALALGAYAFSASAASAATPATVKTATVPGVGTIMVDSQGHALYTLTDATGAAVACTGGCLSAWPPLTATGKVKVAKGVKAVTKTSDTNQVTWKGLPLYLFAGDTAAKEAKGEGIASFGGTWHVVKVKSATASATKSSTSATTGGNSGY
jgi:predicted lipoprotein with Yx(FWY)xxD motif